MRLYSQVLSSTTPNPIRYTTLTSHNIMVLVTFPKNNTSHFTQTLSLLQLNEKFYSYVPYSYMLLFFLSILDMYVVDFSYFSVSLDQIFLHIKYVYPFRLGEKRTGGVRGRRHTVRQSPILTFCIQYYQQNTETPL